MLLRGNLPPASIRPEHKRRYYAALNGAQRGGGTERLEEVICDGILEGGRIVGEERGEAVVPRGSYELGWSA